MAEITAQIVKELRDKTNAGMMDCKKALTEAGGDLEKAIEILRKKGIASYTKRAGREAKEGAIHALLNEQGTVGVLVEVNCETDFVGKNEGFRAFVNGIAEHIVKTPVADGDIAALFAQPYAGGGGTVDEVVKTKGGEVGENIVVRRFRRFEAAPGGALAQYIHLGGRVGVLLEVGATKPETLASDAFRALTRDINLHIAASSPICIERGEIPQELVEKERGIYAEQVKGKPANVLEKIVDGKMVKFYSQVCLLEQGFVKDPDRTVQQLLDDTGRALGDTLTIRRFVRFALGEEIAG